ncbi:MAG TPA: chemotaxis protein CheX [bacterium]|jgi:hypothetical protein|nr:chemotaxis protein CheX [bacterium]
MANAPFKALAPATLAQSMRSVFQEAFALELEGPLAGLERADSRRWICGSVFFSGDWSGVLRMDLPWEMAARLGGLWIGQDGPLEDSAAVNDAVGELANTVAGNLKKLLPGIRGMSVPRVADAQPPNGEPSSQRLQAYFRLLDQDLRVSLVQLPSQFKMIVVPRPDGR